jgi:predicted RNA methylase
VTDVLASETTPAGKPSLFGAAELLAAVAGARRVLDGGCGSGRLTVALALAGAEVTGFDTSSERLDQIANETRNHASPFVKFAPARPAAKVFETSASTMKMPSASQKPPYVENAVAPNTFRCLP